MKSLAEQMSVYQRYHRKPITKLTHFIGVPMIVFAIIGVFNWLVIPLPSQHLPLTWVLIIVLTLYYALLNWRLALGMLAIFMILEGFAISVIHTHTSLDALAFFVIFFVGGWIIQFIGHAFEGKKLALFDNLFQIFIAPTFLLTEACFLFGALPKLKAEVARLAQ